MKKIYWYIICDGKLYLPNGEVPCEEYCPVAPAPGKIVFGLGLINGIPARAVCCEEKLESLSAEQIKELKDRMAKIGFKIEISRGDAKGW